MKKLMNKRTGRAFLFALTLIPVAAIGGYFSVRLLLSSLDPSMLEDAISKAGSEEIVLAVSVIMTVGCVGFIRRCHRGSDDASFLYGIICSNRLEIVFPGKN